MAERRAVATGNWSAPGTWDGGVALPASGDTVHANGFTVTIDQNVTVVSLNTIAGVTAVAGGTFNCSTTRTVNANLVAGTTAVLTFSGVLGTTLTLNGNLTASVTSAVYCLVLSSTGATNFTGNSTGAVSGTNTGGGINVTGDHTLTATGTFVGGNTNGNYAINFSNGITTKACVANGNVRAHPTGAGNGIICSIAGGSVAINGNVADVAGGVTALNCAHNTGTLTVTGDVIVASSISAGHGITHSGNGTIVINGNVTGGQNTAGNCYGVNYTGAGPLTVNGTVKGGTGPTSYGINQTGGGTCYCQKVQGNDYPNSSIVNNVPGWNANSAAQVVTIAKMEFGSGGAPPIAGGRVFVDDAATNECKIRQSNAGAITTMGDVPADYADPANVRYGTVYAFGARTGTLRVPNPASVAVGVLTDATTGTAALTQLTAQQVADALGVVLAAQAP